MSDLAAELECVAAERDRLAAALRASEERFRSTLAGLEEVVYSTSIDGRTVHFIGDACERIYGRPASEFLSNPFLWADVVHPQDAPRVLAGFARLPEASPLVAEYRILRPDGTVRWVHDRTTVVRDAAGAPVRLNGIVSDVTTQMEAETALREKEERIRAIVESEPECVSLLDRDGIVLEMNAAGLRMLDAESLDQVRGKCVCPLVAPEDEPAFRDMLLRVFRGESCMLVFDAIGLRGRRRTFESHAVPMWEDERHRSVRALLKVTRDITEQREAEGARRQLERQLRQSQKMEAIGTLAGGIAHDFNNIVAAIMGRAELLARGLTRPEDVQEAAKSILTASERARDLIRQILTFSRQSEEERSLIALQPVLAEALRLLRSTLPSAIETRVEIDPDRHVVLADATQVHQVLLNLCTNAAHAMRDGGVLSVRYARMEVDEAFALAHPGLRIGPHARLTVADTGHGMDAATLERIFEPFFTTKAQGEGTGLGLSVVHGIMKSHEGLVTVESTPGRGTTFDLYFPIASQPAAADAASERAVPQGEGKSVLVVDDEPALVDFMREALAGMGYRVTGHVCPAEAWTDFCTGPSRFDLVVCDLSMPKMSGLELAARLGAIRPGLPVVLTTGYSGALQADDLPRLGIRELLLKPFRLDNLGEVVHRQLRSTGRGGGAPSPAP